MNYPKSFRRSIRRATPRPQRGVVLIEALVGILIFTIGVLGLVGVQAAMTKAQTAANFRAEAAQLASDVVARMWLNPGNVAAFTSDAGCKAYPSCKEWQERVAARLPGGKLPTVTMNGQRIDIVITWVDPTETDGGGTRRFSTSTSIGV